MSGGWVVHAHRAALDRLAVPGRGIDAAWIARLEDEAIETAGQTGADPFAALSGVRLGVALAMGWVTADAAGEVAA